MIPTVRWMAWRARTNLYPSSQAKYFLCPITRAHCFLSCRQCHPTTPCFLCYRAFLWREKSLHSHMRHSPMPCSQHLKQNEFSARQSGEHWCNLNSKFDYWKFDMWQVFCGPDRDIFIKRGQDLGLVHHEWISTICNCPGMYVQYILRGKTK